MPVFRMLALASAALAVTAGAAAAAAVDRVQVGVPGKGSPTRGFSEGLAVSLTSPPRYERGCCSDFVSGTWVGPRIQSSMGAVEHNAARIDWSVDYARGRRSAEALARAASWANLDDISVRRRSVSHIVGGRRVGKLSAVSVLTGEPAPGARTQAAIAIALGRRVHAIALFTLEDPPADTSSDGALTVEGMPASEWNHRQAEIALGKVSLVGSLPPARVRVRAAGGRLKGSVTDDFLDPVGEVKVILHKRIGGRWRAAGSRLASTRGTFALRARQPGRYRVMATLAGSTAKSPAVRVGG